MSSQIKRFTQLLFFVFAVITQNMQAQDLEALLEQENELSQELIYATFKSTKIVDGQSIENPAKNEYNFIISHHFGTLNSGFYNFYGLDESHIRLGLEYGLSDRIGLAVGRSSFNKIYDLSTKIKLVQQQKGLRNIPFSVSAFGEISLSALDYRNFTLPIIFEHRISYATQLLIASKLSDKISLQISPTFIHQNLVNFSDEPNNKYSVGLSGRFKITKRISFNPEYFYNINFSDIYRNHLALGFDLETGGHVFQLYFGNSRGINTVQYIGETNGSWLDGDIHFGFSINRFFSGVHKNKKNAVY